MPTDYEILQRHFSGDHARVLQEMNEAYPTHLKFNVKGDLRVPEGQLSVKVEKLGIELLPGSGPVDLRVTVARSGIDAESVDSDITKVERFFDAACFARLGRRVQVNPAVRSAEMSLSDPINERVLQETLRILEGLGKLKGSMPETVERSLTWFRDSFQATSTFNHFLMLWNCAENLLVHIGKDDKPTRRKRLEDARKFISSKGESLTLKDIERLNSDIVQQSIRWKMTRGFQTLFGADSRHPISMCFERKPSETQLWLIRNDIGHANIVERDPKQRARVLAAESDLFEVARNSIWKTLKPSLQIPWGI